MIVFNSIILSLEGNTGVAAYGVIANLSLVVVAVYTGISQGIQPLLSRYFGLSDRKGSRTDASVRAGGRLDGGLLLHGRCRDLFLRFPIAGIFDSEGDPLLQQIAAEGLRLYFTAIPFAGFDLVLFDLLHLFRTPPPGQRRIPAPWVYHHHPDGIPSLRPLRAERGLVRLPRHRGDRRRHRPLRLYLQPQKGIKIRPAGNTLRQGGCFLCYRTGLFLKAK